MKHLAFLGLALLASCGPAGTPDIAVSDGWIRESTSGPSAAYATIANRGSATDRLVGVDTASGSASLHETTFEGGVARMSPLQDGLEIPAGGSVRLEPGAAHVMLMGLDRPLTAGRSVSMTLTFERSGERQVDFVVRGGADASGGQQ